MRYSTAGNVGVGGTGGLAVIAIVCLFLPSGPQTRTRLQRCRPPPIIEEYLATPVSPAERFFVLDHRARAALANGQLVVADLLAIELLMLAPAYRRTFHYGNAIHDGHTVRGLVALARGELERAKAHLASSANTPGSPQLDTFGPSLALAKALVERGEYAAVMSFLERCGRFWELGRDDLQRWQTALVVGRVPNFGPHACR